MTHLPPIFPLGAAFTAQHLIARRHHGSPKSRAVALPVAGLGLGLIGAAVMEFRRHETTMNPSRVDRASSLIENGIFGYTRNPIYIGMASLLVSYAIARRAAAALIPVAAFVVAIDKTQIPVEEKALSDKFGSEYATYRNNVPRWIGWRR